MLKGRFEIVVETVAILGMVYFGSAIVGRAMRSQTYGKLEAMPLVGPVALGLRAVRQEAVS